MTLVPVILSGGAGTRLWPLSRQQQPKQFLRLVGPDTMFAATLARLDGLAAVADPIVVGNAAQRELIEVGLADAGRTAAAILLEPVGRNTAPAVAVAALRATAQFGSDPILLVLPADHVVADLGAFAAAVERARPRAETGDLVTFGVVPTEPHTGYGYIRASDDTEVSAVAAFVEKPDAETAARYVAGGDYLWNSGMFLLRASAYLDALQAHAPDMVVPCRRAVDEAVVDEPVVRLDTEAFAGCPADSIDYAVMEKTDRAAVVRLDAGWSDVGSWDATWGLSARDAAGNAVAGDVVAIDSEGCLLDARHGALAAVGLRDVVVVVTEDAVLVAPRAEAQRVKDVVAALTGRRSSTVVTSPDRGTGWGREHDLGHVAPGVRRLSIAPGREVTRRAGGTARIVAVQRGRAQVTEGGHTRVLETGDSAAVPPGAEYRLENAESAVVVVVEIDAAP